MQSIKLHELLDLASEVQENDQDSLSRIVCEMHAQVCKCLESRDKRVEKGTLSYNRMLMTSDKEDLEGMWIKHHEANINGTFDQQVAKMLIMVLDVCNRMEIPIEEAVQVELSMFKNKA